MPPYEYQLADDKRGCPLCRKGFEIQQGMKDDPLAECPRCGAAIHRVIGRVNVATGSREKSLLSDTNLKRHGFKTLRNEGDGKFSVS